MATKADFTEAEWETLQRGVSGAGTMVALAHPGFRETFKEAGAMARHLREAHDRNPSVLVRDLAALRGTGFGLTSSDDEVETKTLAALESALGILRAKAPDEVEAYQAFVLDIAESVAAAAKGVDPAETDAVERIRGVLAGDAAPPA